MSPDRVDIGFQTNSLLQKAKRDGVCDRAVSAFKIECKDFLVATIAKLTKKSPLKFAIVRNVSCLNPLTMDDKAANKNKMKMVLQCMVEMRRIEETQADDALSQYCQFLDSTAVACGASRFDVDAETEYLVS